MPEDIESRFAKTASGRADRQFVERKVAELGEYLELQGFSLDEDGFAALEYNDSFELGLAYLDHLPGIVASAPMPTGLYEYPQVVSALLAANLDWRLTHGGCFASFPGDEDIYLFSFISLCDTDVQALDRQLASFAEFARQWRLEVSLNMTAEQQCAAPGEMPMPTRVGPALGMLSV